MGKKKNFDVIVIGAGPAGSAAAKRCVEQGLQTLILEKRKLPRDKVCSGMLFSKIAKKLVMEEFGELPQQIILANLSGVVLMVPGVDNLKINRSIPITWRRDLDYWMNQIAKEKGAEIWDEARVVHVRTENGKCIVELEEAGKQVELEARFVIAADGANSITRRFLFPGLKIGYTNSYRECYEGSLKLDKDYSYIVFPRYQYRPNFFISHKGECFTIDGALKELKSEVARILVDYGPGEPKLLWKDGCVARALLFEHLSSGSFTPAKGNILLVGDAAGLKNPINGEGIHTALESALIAANSIMQSGKTGLLASTIYLKELSPILTTLRSQYAEIERIKVQANKSPAAFLFALAKSI
jgi:flavin-dependent dehydrogenase